MAAETGNIAVLAEKPSVARDIARVLGASIKGEGYLHGNGYVVTWAIGHLAALAEPAQINPSWKSWRRDTLPMLPNAWPLVVYEKTKDQFEVVRRILTSPKIGGVVCATDAGREGELIFRYIYEAAGCHKPFRRLWISSLTPEAIRKGFDTLKPGVDYDPLADAATGRSRADWLVGMNLSRAYSLAYNEDLSVGRVQTPTLAMLVERELAIRSFVPEDYIEVVATFRKSSDASALSHEGTWFRPRGDDPGDKESLQQSMRLPPGGEESARIIERARSGAASILSVKSETQRMGPPLFYDLTELQRHANRLYGFSAQQTLDLAQSLYESHKLISYPRTDSRHLSADVAATLPRIVKTIEEPYRAMIAPGTGERPLGKRFVDDTKVTDHHAIIPTVTSPARANLSANEQKIHDLICRRLLSAWHDDHIWAVTTVITVIRNAEITDHYHTSGTAIQQVGWKALDIVTEKKAKRGKGARDEDTEEASLPPGLEPGQPQDVLDVEGIRKKTRAPKRFTEATLLTAMETAGKAIDEKELSDAMKETGLGTPATRAAIIEVLYKRGYTIRSGKSIEATDKGIHLIEVVHPEVKSPVMTGQWEAYLKRIQRGNGRLDDFMRGIENYVREVVGRAGERPVPAPAPAPTTQAVAAAAQPARPAQHDGTIEGILHSAFGFSGFRPNQETVCREVAGGRDVLLVMPTGSGKSLCYQLPGIARGGTTLVISPLIALMEDQVAQLASRGFAVDRIHSGRDRAASRQACVDYLNGRLQFLFIAPERLRVAGFPEMLAKRKPSLVAIDEAHCISQWGHDFRPDYRMLGQYLPNLRPAVVMGLTATATPVVQDDICQQLGLINPGRFIHGFRRENIAIEVVEVAPSMRGDLARELLSDEDARPGIIYAPTRKQANAIASECAAHFPTAVYHAGLDAEHRKRVQEQFLSSRVEVMVATIAFGMGIDKPDVRTVVHTGLPGSVEAYYQEIGRAGRDGKPSRAILMHSYADRYTHDFFFERDYPPVETLDAIFARLHAEPQPKELLQHQVRMGQEVFDKALEKLWIHGGAVLDYAENATRGGDGWREAYSEHGELKRGQIELILRYAETSHCRMSTLVRHFGDLADSQRPCGVCDFCAPENCVAQRFREPSAVEKSVVGRVLESLRVNDSKSVGKLHGELCASDLSRDEFEEVLGAMARGGLLRLTDAVFEKDGKKIPYRVARLTPAGRGMEDAALPELTIKDAMAMPRKGKRTRKAAKKTAKATPKAAASKAGASKAAASKQPASTKPAATPEPANSDLESKLRDWRLAEARRQGVPAFRILTDQVLKALAARRPATASELLAIPGIGMHTVEKYGRQLYLLVKE